MTGERSVTAGGSQGAAPIVADVHGATASGAAVDWAVTEARLRRAAVHLVLLARDPALSCRASYACPAAPTPATLTPSSSPGLPSALPGCFR